MHLFAYIRVYHVRCALLCFERDAGVAEHAFGARMTAKASAYTVEMRKPALYYYLYKVRVRRRPRSCKAATRKNSKTNMLSPCAEKLLVLSVLLELQLSALLLLELQLGARIGFHFDLVAPPRRLLRLQHPTIKLR